MAVVSPLNPIHQQAEATFLMYGPPINDQRGGTPVAVVETFGELEAEYAALRKGCVLLDQPHRGVIEVSGRDRLDFLGRMVTQEMKGFPAMSVRRGFWLNRKGRIDADLRMVQLEDRMWIDVDVLAARRAADSLASFLFSEDVTITDRTPTMHRLALHGPSGPALLAAACGAAAGTLPPDGAAMIRVAGHDVTVFRDDSTGETGLELLLEAAAVPEVYEALLRLGLDGAGGFRLRTAGWHAFNIARIEAGRAMFNIDFGTESLPHECGPETLRDRVSFTKGCYLGQEIVARMQSLGHPRQVLAGLELDDTPGGEDAEGDRASHQPTSGAALMTPDDSGEARTIGAVTSSTRSPMLGDRAVCFAQVKWEHARGGARVRVQTEAGPVGATVKDSLVFYKRA